MALDADELTERYRAHRAEVLGLCRHLLGSTDQAEDAAQEVFVRARRHWDTFDPSRPFAAWILSIASHHCIDLLRRRSREAKFFGNEDVERTAIAATGPGPLGALLDQEQRQAVQAAVAALPAKYRVPLVLAIYQEQPYDDIGRALGVPRSHVAVLVFRAKQLLRATLASPGRSGGSRVVS